MRNRRIYLLAIAALALGQCTQQKKEAHQVEEKQGKGTFAYDLAFLQKHKEVIVLTAPDNPASQVAIVGDYQGRVMTSTADGPSGNSYGWINYALIESKKPQPHIHAFGGEERFWLSPEGGQFSVYFKKGAKFDFENWQTPAVIDSEPFDLISRDSVSVSFHKVAQLENHSGAKFDFMIDRKVTILEKKQIADMLQIELSDKVKATAYETTNMLTNHGSDWKKETGTIGIWLLGMFTPGPQTVIIAPFTTTKSAKPLLTDHYFGSIPKDRLVVKDSAVYLKADGKYRSKIGLAPQSARKFAGSFDPEKNILTIIRYDLDADGEYLKSTWEEHKEPYKGDALNAYNDGPLADGTQMGPFYELESNSPTRPLKMGETLTHVQRTYHFEGDKKVLQTIAMKVLGVDIDQIGEIFK